MTLDQITSSESCMLYLDRVGHGILFASRNWKIWLDKSCMTLLSGFTSVADGRDSAVEVFEADHTKATGIQKLGQILHL